MTHRYMASFRPFVILQICYRSFFKLVINCVHISTTVSPKSQTQDASHIRIKTDRDIWRESCPERAPFSNRGPHIDRSVSLGWGLLKPHTCICSISGACDQEVRSLSQFLPFSYFSLFRRCQNTRELLKYHACIWRVSPQLSCDNTDKYEHDSKDLAGTFTRSKILLTEKYSNGDLVTHTPGGGRSSAFIRYTFYYKRKSWDRLSHAYLTGTTTVRLRWHQPSMSATKVLNRAHKRESYKHRKMFCNRHLYEHTYRQ